MSYVKVCDTRLTQLSPDEADIIVKEGAQNVAYIPLVSASLSTQNCTFNLNNIATNVCRARRMCINFDQSHPIVFNLNVSGTATDPIFSALGFRQFPVNNSIANIAHQINQASYSLNLNQILPEIAKCNLETENANFYDNSQYDAISNYSNAVGTNISPLNDYTSCPTGWGVFKPRTNNIVLSTNVSTGANQNITITCQLYEPLASPFNNIGRHEDSSLFAINGELLQIQWVANIFNSMISAALAPGITLNSVTTTFPSSVTLDLLYITPNQDYMAKIPRNSISHYNNYSIFSQDNGALNAGASGTLTSPVCQITNVSYKILVYVRQSDATKSAFIPDRYANITGISNCQFDNGSNQLSSASQNQLYELSNRNGLVLDRDVWQQKLLNPFHVANGGNPIFGCGSILVLDPKIDLGLREDISDGSPGRYIFQITLNIKNDTTDNFTGTTMYVVAVNNAVLERNNGSEYRNYLLSLSPDAVQTVMNQEPISHREYMEAIDANMWLSGGSFKSFFGKVWKGVKNAGKWAYKHRDEIAKGVKTGLDIYKALKGKGGYALGGDGMTGVYDQARYPYPPQHMGQSFSEGRHPPRKMDLFYQ